MKFFAIIFVASALCYAYTEAAMVARPPVDCQCPVCRLEDCPTVARACPQIACAGPVESQPITDESTAGEADTAAPASAMKQLAPVQTCFCPNTCETEVICPKTSCPPNNCAPLPVE